MCVGAIISDFIPFRRSLSTATEIRPESLFSAPTHYPTSNRRRPLHLGKGAKEPLPEHMAAPLGEVGSRDPRPRVGRPRLARYLQHRRGGCARLRPRGPPHPREEGQGELPQRGCLPRAADTRRAAATAVVGAVHRSGSATGALPRPPEVLVPEELLALESYMKFFDEKNKWDFFVFLALEVSAMMITAVATIITSIHPGALSFLVANFFLFFGLVVLTFVHASQIACNITTNETANALRYSYLRGPGGRFHNPYDHGILRN